jgi:multisubunit Na+/H+ antiporter MnhF subunit
MILAAFALLVVAAAGFVARLVAGPSLPDRVLAIDGLLVIIVAGLAIETARSGEAWFVDAAVVIGLLGYIGTGVAARLIEHDND